jgi:hypothetical protein
MNEDALSETLHDAFADVQIGPPPLARMHKDAGRIRRTRFAAVASAAAVVAVVGGVATWGALSGNDSATELPPAAGVKYVGLDRVLVAVPDSWVRVPEPTSAYCGSEDEDVVAYNAPDCDPAHQDAVHLYPGRAVDPPDAWVELEVSGEPAIRTPVREHFADPGDGEPTVWTGRLYVDRVVVSVISSRSADVVSDLLDSVQLSEGN